MSTTVPGIYRDGKLELLEKPTRLREGRVLVILVEQPDAASNTQSLQYGKYKGNRLSTEEDFKLAEFDGDRKFADL